MLLQMDDNQMQLGALLKRLWSLLVKISNMQQAIMGDFYPVSVFAYSIFHSVTSRVILVNKEKTIFVFAFLFKMSAHCMSLWA